MDSLTMSLSDCNRTDEDGNACHADTAAGGTVNVPLQNAETDWWQRY